jgi:hypothetical protein
MSASRLLLYNDALTMCGERMLSSVSESREARRLLDQAWDSGAVVACLEQGQWNFATRSIQLEYSPSVEPDFGYSRAFDKPTDWVRTVGLCSDEFFRVPLTEYFDEADFWFAELDTIYVRYVSDDDSYGMDMGKWPQTFAKYVSTYLANEIVTKLTNGEARALKIERSLKIALRDAKSKDAINEATKFLPSGTWASARLGTSRRDGGGRGNLTE